MTALSSHLFCAGEAHGSQDAVKPMTSPAIEAQRKLVIALDVPSAVQALELWNRIALPHAVCKIGLELLFSGGIDLARSLASAGVKVFVDAKLFDIGNTVERATARVADLGASYLTVHAHYPQTMRAAVKGKGDSPLALLGVTVLTDVQQPSPASQDEAFKPEQLVLQRATYASEAGFDGVIASPLEARMLKRGFDVGFTVACPGIRLTAPAAGARDDQARTASPRAAILNGADLIVVGRPIIEALDPTAVASAVVAEIADALALRKTPSPL